MRSAALWSGTAGGCSGVLPEARRTSAGLGGVVGAIAPTPLPPPGYPLMLDEKAELVVAAVAPDSAILRCMKLPTRMGQSMGALDLAQILELEEGLRACGDVCEDGCPHAPSWQSRKLRQRGREPRRSRQPVLADIGDNG